MLKKTGKPTPLSNNLTTRKLDNLTTQKLDNLTT